MPNHEVVESTRWRRDDGQSASIYGACPWTSEVEKVRWKLETSGFTVRNLRTGIIGIGRVPWATCEEAQAWIDAQSLRTKPVMP